MSEKKYSEYGTITLNGKKRVIYTKNGSTKKYLKYKGRMMNLVKYKKMLQNKKKLEAKKLVAKNVKVLNPVKKIKKSKGGFFADAESSKKTPPSTAGSESNVASAFKQVALGVSNNLKNML